MMMLLMPVMAIAADTIYCMLHTVSMYLSYSALPDHSLSRFRCQSNVIVAHVIRRMLAKKARINVCVCVCVCVTVAAVRKKNRFLFTTLK